MRIAKVVSALGVLIMAATLLYGFIVGDFAGEGAQLLRMPWGIVSLIDVYIMVLDHLPREVHCPIGDLGDLRDSLGLLHM